MTKTVCQLCDKILESDEWPTAWLRTIFILIAKIAGTTQHEGRRTIELTSHTSKVSRRILFPKMTKTAEEKIS